MTVIEERISRAVLWAASDIHRAEAGMWTVGPAFTDARLATRLVDVGATLDDFEECVNRALFSSPGKALQTLVGLGLETELGTDTEGTR